MSAALPRLDVLVNNVGGFWNSRHVTVDGLERTFALNHLAPFLLTHLLVDRLVATAPARIVTVPSDAQRFGRVDFDDLQGERSWSGQRAYKQSKLGNVLFTYELARRLRGTGVTANALHPGIVRSGLGVEETGRIQRLLAPFTRFRRSPDEGARTSIHLASCPEPRGSPASSSGMARRCCHRSGPTTRPTRCGSTRPARTWSVWTPRRPADSALPPRQAP